MNKIIKNGQEYTLICEDGQEFECSRWHEKKTNAWHIKLPKDNPSGRTYIRESYFKDTDEYEFETKTEFRTGLTSGGWRAKMTDEERTQVEEAERLIKNIKKICMERTIDKPEKNSIEWYENEIRKLMEKKAKLTK